MFYVSPCRTVCFPYVKRTVLQGETYVSRKGNIKKKSVYSYLYTVKSLSILHGRPLYSFLSNYKNDYGIYVTKILPCS